MSDEFRSKGSTTLDYLRVRYEWLGKMIDESERKHANMLAALIVAEDVLAQLLNEHGGDGDQWNGLSIVQEAIAKAEQ